MAGLYIPKRFILILLAHFGFVVVYALRVNLSVAIVSMVNSTYSHGSSSSSDPECATKNKTLTDNGGEFNWNQNDQGIILSSFFYGYLLTQLPGGWWANKFGGKWVFGFGVLATAALTLLTTIAARASLYWLIALRVLEGIGEGVTFPAMHSIIGQWAPSVERSKLSALAYSGMHMGTIIALPVSGVLADSSFLGGWPSVFYVFGAIGFVWFFLWLIFISNSPESHPTISYEERKLITRDKHSNQNVRVPWKQIFLSLPVWACVVAHFCNNWVWYMVLTGLPSYFKQVLDFDLKENGFLSALPFIAAFCTSLSSGVIADFLRKNYLSTTRTRKLMCCLGFFPAAIFLILASYANCNQIALSVTYMTLATGMLNINTSGYFINLVDLSPNFSGILMGIANTFGTVAGCITPSVTGYYTNDHATRGNYRKVFIVASVISCIGGIFYFFCANAELQSWDNVEPTTNKKYGNDGITEDDEQRPLVDKFVE